mgnify:CR=1 FL=1
MKKLIAVTVLCIIIFSAFSQNIIKYTTSNLNLRSDANVHSGTITVIPQGIAVSLAENCKCKWILVSYHGYTGYVRSKYLSLNKSPHHQQDHGRIKYYINSEGRRIQSPTYYSSTPVGATALCRDGSYSFSQNHRGTCSHHGGVAKWFR